MPDALALCRLDVRVRHRDRMRDQRLDRAQVFRERAELHGVHELLAGLDAALHLEPEHRAEAARLLLRERVLREALEAWVANLRHLRVRLEELRDCLRVRRLALDPDRQRLRALEREPRDERRHDHAGRVLHEAHLLVELFAIDDHRAADRRVVAVEVLRGAVHRDVRAELERPLVVRREKRVVDGVRDLALFRDLRDRRDVAELQRRVCRRLGENQLRVVAQRLADGLRIGAIRERELDAEARVDLGREAIRAAVRDVRDHRVVAGRERCLEHDLLRRHAGRVARAGGAVLEHRELLLERAHGRVAAARVREAF